MTDKVIEAYDYVNLSASGVVKTGSGSIIGFICASSSSGTVKLFDNTAASGNVVLNTMNMTAATFYPCPARFRTGLYATIGGTADVTFFKDTNG